VEKIVPLTLGFACILSLGTLAQSTVDNQPCPQPSTVILFRTFNVVSFGDSYKIYASDSLLGKIKTHDVIVLTTFDKGITLQATTKAPSVNADRRTNFQKHKKINYPISLGQEQVYFVKCGYLAQNVFDLPHQPTIRLLKPAEVKKYLKKRFLRKKIKAYLYQEWLTDKKIIKPTSN
jgi:hypothetical protein